MSNQQTTCMDMGREMVLAIAFGIQAKGNVVKIVQCAAKGIKSLSDPCHNQIVGLN